MSMLYRIHVSGAREVFDVELYKKTHPEARLCRCGTCHRYWDDAHVSAVTPAPAARCPFESYHKLVRGMTTQARNEDRAPYHVPGRPSALEHYTEQARLAMFDPLRDALSVLLSTLASCREIGKLKGGELAAEADARRLLARLPGASVPVKPEADTCLRITIPDDAWEETGSGSGTPEAEREEGDDPRSRLLTQLNINGCPMHLEAYAVKPDTDIQEAADPTFADDIERLQAMQDARFVTTTIREREYILVATPHGD